MSRCAQLIQEKALNTLFDSGKFFEQLGLFNQCKNDNLQYSLSIFMDKNTGEVPGLYMGLCLPQECNHDIIKFVLDSYLGQITNYVVLTTVDDPQELEFEKNWLYYPIWIIIATLIVLTAVSTISQKYKLLKSYEGKTFHNLLNTFDLHESFKIFTHKNNVFNVFNGIKTICMFWVIFGHEFSVRLRNDVNAATLPPTIETWFYLFVIAAFFAVDVFFFIGGFLVAYSFLRQKSRNPLKYPMAILHRVLRFWPSYLMTILIYYALFLHSGSGPLWWMSKDAGQVEDCAQIWKPLFFVDNLVDNGQTMCLGWGWYLQNDMQVFILCMAFLFVLSLNKKAANVVIWVFILASIIYNFVEVQINEYVQVTHLIDFKKWGVYFPDIYIKPWTRCPPYLLGLFFGIQYMEYLSVEKKIKQLEKDERVHQRESINSEEKESQAVHHNFSHPYITLKKKLQSNRGLVYLFQIAGFALMLFIVVIPRTLQVGGTWPQFLHSFYLSTGKVFFVSGLYLMILPSLLDVPNFVFFIMDTKFFNVVSKISFWTYLIHYMVVLQVTYSQKIDFYYSISDILPLYVPIAGLSLLFGFIGTMLVEVPFAKMEKMLITTLMGKKKEKVKEQKTQSLLTEPLNTTVEPTNPSLKISVKSHKSQQN